MRNITVSDFQRHQLEKIQNCEVFCIDQSSLYVYNNGYVVKFEGSHASQLCDLSGTLYDGNLQKAVRISYCLEKDTIFLFLQNGDIVSIEANGESDVVGSVESGIKAAEWSPEQELIALVTGNDTVILMTSDFDPLSEVSLHSSDFGERQFITVGWGKKETQFRGSEGKFNIKAKDIKEETNCHNINSAVKISWRGDAELFAVSCICPETSNRYLRIFSREGILQYTSEHTPGLEDFIDWRPSGNLITTTQRLPNKHNVCFFEKNGLKHGEFTLSYKHDEVLVRNLLWNLDSKLLALLVEKISEKEKFIHIYTSQNYHWYCKYNLQFKNENVVITWDKSDTNLLHVLHSNDQFFWHSKLKWLWTVSKSKGQHEGDEAFVGVIDGNKVLLTTFKKGITPPPMCTFALELDLPVNAIGFGTPFEDLNSNDLFVQLFDGSLLFYKYIDNKYELSSKLPEKDDFCYNYQWVPDKTLMFCKVKAKDSKPYLSCYNLEDNSETETPLTSTIALLKIIDNSVLIHDNSGKLFDASKVIACSMEKLNLIEMEISKRRDGTYVIFALDKSNKFYVNDKNVANNITSFHIHGEFILLTSLKQQLLTLSTECLDFAIADVCSRKIERGARLVTSVPKDTKVVLQMPRGNLECVQPRSLSFSVIGKYLDALEFHKAFEIMRKQRINLNLLHDHNPGLFVANVDKFIDQIRDPSWISLFLSELGDEDVTKTMYSSMYKDVRDATEAKVSDICQLMEKTLTERPNSGDYFLSVLTTYIKRNETRHIEAALSKIKALKEKEENGGKPAVTSNEALKYILYLIDVEELYKVALGMYDFDLVLFIASKSQKDPKEYLPFLNDLRKLEGNYQKYMIDKHLKRYEKALRNLILCDGDEFFNESLNFIKEHKLYKIALKSIPRTTDRYKQICASYGEELINTRSYQEAGIMFSNAGSYGSAMTAFRKAGNWQEVIFCAQQLTLSPQELNNIYSTLAAEMSEAKRFKESSAIYLDYLKNVEECLSVLCTGKLFTEAFRIANLFGRSDIIQSQIKPSIIGHYTLLKNLISTHHETLQQQKKRLAVFRAQKLNDALDFEKRNDQMEQDLYSETSTVVTQSYASRSTARTFRSSKNRRKQERKLLSLKEGNPFEDIALIVSLHSLVTNCFQMTSDVLELNLGLLKIKEEDKAENLQKIFDDLLKEIENSKSEIWNAELMSGRQEYGPDATSNSIAAMHTRQVNSTPNSLPLLQPQQAIPPTMQNIRWQLEILKP